MRERTEYNREYKKRPEVRARLISNRPQNRQREKQYYQNPTNRLRRAAAARRRYAARGVGRDAKSRVQLQLLRESLCKLSGQFAFLIALLHRLGRLTPYYRNLILTDGDPKPVKIHKQTLISECSKLTRTPFNSIGKWHSEVSAPIFPNCFALWLSLKHKRKREKAMLCKIKRHIKRGLSKYAMRKCRECGLEWYGDHRAERCKPCVNKSRNKSRIIKGDHRQCIPCLLSVGCGQFLTAVLTRFSIPIVGKIARSGDFPKASNLSVRPIDFLIPIPESYQDYKARKNLCAKTSLTFSDLPPEVVEVKKQQLKLKRELARL